MARHIRIPLLADLILTDDVEEIRQLADHSALDRDFDLGGPVANRVLSRRVKTALSLDGAALPSAMMRGDAKRAAFSKDLSEIFVPGNWDSDTMAEIVAYVRGGQTGSAGELAQQITGRVFDPGYTATDETWEAALAIEVHLRSSNPIQRLVRFFAGSLRKAQQTLGRASNDNLGAVHGTGIAVHNLALSIDRLRDDWADGSLKTRLNPQQAALRAIAAPRTVMRVAKRHCDSIGGHLRPGTLVAMNTRAAASAGMNPEPAFLSASWSHCPAEKWVLALLVEIWRQAGDE